MNINDEIDNIIDKKINMITGDTYLKKREIVKTIIFALMNSLDKMKQIEIELTNIIEKNCKHDWIPDRSTYDPCRSYHMCTICGASN